ncbi:hypothetical protein GGU11DRAFT_793253 [Lentinula aff. detonsa]|nr:hypothetical protein GGU11DRAFT_793253 [Lentinula aff. detonsa]
MLWQFSILSWFVVPHRMLAKEKKRTHFELGSRTSQLRLLFSLINSLNEDSAFRPPSLFYAVMSTYSGSRHG